MASWTFVTDYGKQYPALKSSVLNLLVFSEHALNGTAFTGTLDVAASGAALGTIGKLLGLPSIAVAGQVTNVNDKLTVTLNSTDAKAFRDGIAGSIPLIGKQVTAASMSINTVTTPKDDPDTGPQTDNIDFSVTLAIGAASVTIGTQVPMHGGLFTIEGTFVNVGVTLNDLSFLMGTLGPGNKWFPSSELGPYNQGQPALSLLGLSITVYVNLSPFKVSVSSVAVGIGITGINLMDKKLYLNPIGVWATVEDPAGSPSVEWAIQGAIALCNYARPGDYQNPDFTFDFAMNLTNFAVSGEFENPASLTIEVMLQDLLGQGTNIGIPKNLTLDRFAFDAAADKSTGKLTEFSTAVAMSGGFGLFESFDLEEISISVAYAA
jgi:hypothetical protein